MIDQLLVDYQLILYSLKIHSHLYELITTHKLINQVYIDSKFLLIYTILANDLINEYCVFDVIFFLVRITSN